MMAVLQLQKNNSELVEAMSQLKESNSQLVTANSQMLMAISQLQTNNSELVAAMSHIEKTNSELVTAMTEIQANVTSWMRLILSFRETLLKAAIVPERVTGMFSSHVKLWLNRLNNKKHLKNVGPIRYCEPPLHC